LLPVNAGVERLLLPMHIDRSWPEPQVRGRARKPSTAVELNGMTADPGDHWRKSTHCCRPCLMSLCRCQRML